MKKLFAALLTLAMLLALAMPAMAVDDGKIIITDAVKDQKYTIHKVFDLTYSATPTINDSTNIDNGQPERVSYTYTKTGASDALYDALADAASSPFTLTATSETDKYQVTLKDGKDIDDIVKFLTDNKSKLPAGTEKTADSTTVTFDTLSYGYYYIESSVGAAVMINSTTKEISITSKNSAPILTYQDETTLDVNRTAGYGDEEEFTLTLTAGKGAQNYVVHVTVPDGLTFDSTSVTVQKAAWNETSSSNDTAADWAASNYTLTAPAAADGHTFDLTLTADGNKDLSEKDQIIIKYKATVNNGQTGATPAATVRGDGNKSEAYMTYGAADPAETGPKTSDTVYVYDFTVSKYFMNAAVKTALPGAKFKLYKIADSKTYYAQVTAGKLTGWTETEADGTELESGAAANPTTDKSTFKVEGLDAGEYLLKETYAPEGFNILADPVKFKVGEEFDKTKANVFVWDTSDYSATAATDNTIEVENNTGSRLPSTGGIGTTIFYVVGSILVLGAVILLITKKKMSGYDDQK